MVIDFIDNLRESDDYIKIIYLNGGCYKFYKVLKGLYPNAVAYKVKVATDDKEYDHIVTYIDNNYYDITGIVNDKYFDRKKVENNELKEVETWNFSKKNRLYKLCENCSEEVYF